MKLHSLPLGNTLLRLMATSLLGLALGGCSTKLPSTSLQSIQIQAAVNANQNTATALDLVFVYDSNALPLLPKTGSDWFDQKAALMASLATSLDVMSLQIPAISTLNLPQERAFPDRYKKAIGVYSYANYVKPGGQLMANLTPYGSVVIQLTPDTILIQGQEPLGLFKNLFSRPTAK